MRVRAYELTQRYSISYWDALLIGACNDAGVERLYSEDLDTHDGLGGMEIINLFGCSKKRDAPPGKPVCRFSRKTLLWPVSDRATPPTEGLHLPGDLWSGVSAGSGDTRRT